MEDFLLLIDKFKNRQIKAKELFYIKKESKKIAYDFVKKYHYLAKAKFFSKLNYGLYYKNMLCGISSYSNPQGTMTLKGWFNMENSCQDIVELSRLCMLPILNKTNATSYLLSGSIKLLKKEQIKAVITLADSSRHNGLIYKICNFKYYGLSNQKKDFYCINGKINPRGSTKDKEGVWLERTRKHRYAYIMDKSLKILLEEQEYPNNNTYEYKCCDGSGTVYDKRHDVYYTCPKCNDKFEVII